jgi:ParB-like chromosome segregation protein Spo0J
VPNLEAQNSSGRVMAARKLGMTSVPVIELADLTPDHRRA